MDSRQVERVAAAWLAKRDSGDWSDTDQREFDAWQDQSTAHRIAVIRIDSIWQRADRLRALGAGVRRGQIPARGSWRLSPRIGPGNSSVMRSAPPAMDSAEDEISILCGASEGYTKSRPDGIKSHTLKLTALAAVLILTIGPTSIWYLAGYEPDTYRSEIGVVKTVSLADGSVITLNTNSNIHVALTDTERRIDLVRGEAFFEVAKDPGRPFIVNAGGKRIIAVGTKFSVFRETLDTRVVVTEGQVKVQEVEDGVAVGPATQVPAGSIAQAGSAGVLVRSSTVAVAETYTSWRSGYIVLHDTQLSEAVAEFNRYTKKQLVIADPAIADLRVGGNLRATNVEAFVRVLEEGFPVRAQILGDRILLTGLPNNTMR